MADLRTDYKDDLLDTSVNTQRKYRMVTNDDGTVSFVDATVYTQNGDTFGASEVNQIHAAVNLVNKSLNVKTLAIATNAILMRIGNLRILQLSETTYSTIKNYKLEETDAPTSTIYSSGFRTTDVGAYITIAEIVVRDGAISCYCADHYNNSEMGLAELGDTNKITGNIVWVV